MKTSPIDKKELEAQIIVNDQDLLRSRDSGEYLRNGIDL